MWQAGLRGEAEGEGWCGVLFHRVGTYWCGCAAKWRGLAGRALASTSYTKGKKTCLGLPGDTTHPVKEISNEDITSVCKWARSGMERAASPLRIGLSLGNWHAEEAEHL